VNNKAAAFMRDIVEGCDKGLQSRSQGIPVKLRRLDSKNAVWLFDVRGSKSAHRVRVKAMRKGNVKDVSKTHVRVSCSCPFWQWQGPEHWAKQGDYLYGRPHGTASKPAVKDPRGDHRACKHVLAVFNHVLKRGWRVPSARRKKLGSRFPLNSPTQDAVRALAARYIGLKAWR